MKKPAPQVLAGLLVAGLPALAAAGTITHSVPFSYSPLVGDGVIFPVIQGFDTLGGTRRLDAVTFAFDHQFTIEMFVESTGPTAVQTGDFSLNFAYITLFLLGTVDPLTGARGGGGGPPLIGPGAFFIDNFSADLAAYDGIPGNDGPDSTRRTFADAYTHTQTYTGAEQDVLDAVTDVGALTTVYGGFTELFFAWKNDPNWPVPPGGAPSYPTDAALWVSFSNFVHSGTIHVTYAYSDVPAPTTALPLAAAGLLGLRRRR